MTNRRYGEWKSGALFTQLTPAQTLSNDTKSRDLLNTFKQGYLLLDDKIILDREFDNWHRDDRKDNSKHRIIYHGSFKYDDRGFLQESLITDWSHLLFQTYSNPVTNEILWTREDSYSYKFNKTLKRMPDDKIDMHQEADYTNYEYNTEGEENLLEDRSEALKISSVTTDRGVIEKFDVSPFMAAGWHEIAYQEDFYKKYDQQDIGKDPIKNDPQITAPAKFKIRAIDKITNFNPSTDTLEIDTDSFGIDSSATFAAGKNKKAVKRQLAKLDIDFLYDEKRGGLYFNENGSNKGFGDGGIIAILKGAPELTSGNLEFL